MIHTILHTPWGLMRWLRLAIGFVFIYFGITNHDTFAGLAGGFFVIQSVFNLGCCGVNTSCATKKIDSKNKDIDDVSYEEVK